MADSGVGFERRVEGESCLFGLLWKGKPVSQLRVHDLTVRFGESLVRVGGIGGRVENYSPNSHRTEVLSIYDQNNRKRKSPMGKLGFELTLRLGGSHLHGFEGEFAIVTDVGSAAIRVRRGRVEVSSEGCLKTVGKSEIPQGKLMQLLTGYQPIHPRHTNKASSDPKTSPLASCSVPTGFPIHPVG